MRVYLAAAMTSEDRDVGAIAAIRDHLEAGGHAVPTRHVAEEGGRDLDATLSDHELAARDVAWLKSCTALVAEVSTPSHGVGIEVALATARGIPVLLLHRSGRLVSRLLLGLDGVEAVAYGAIGEALAAVDEFLARAAAAENGCRRHLAPGDAVPS